MTAPISRCSSRAASSETAGQGKRPARQHGPPPRTITCGKGTALRRQWRRDVTGQWLGKAAVLWALDEAPDVPPNLLAALIAIARYADENGRGAHPSASTIAAHIRKSERHAKRDLGELAKLGLLVPGNQRIVAYIRADRRPAVYDLPMPRGDAQTTPSAVNGVTHKAPRGDVQGPHGVVHTSPEEILKGSRGRARGNGAGAPPRSQPKIRVSPPCSVCGHAFSTAMLADDDTYEMALAGELIHGECAELERRQAEAEQLPYAEALAQARAAAGSGRRR